MKKTFLTGTVILALACAGLQSARAGDREWATVGKVLTGAALAGLIVAATDGHAQCSVTYSAPAYCPTCPPPAPPCAYNYCLPPAPQVVYCAPPVVIARPPVIYYPARPVVYHPNKWLNHERWIETHDGR